MLGTAHPLYKTGKLPAKFDKNTLRFDQILHGSVKAPAEYSFDTQHPGVPMPMFANDKLGCCVISEVGHQTLRFELLEQGKIITITDKDITTEYFKESGGVDSGLVILDSLKAWVKGWKVATKTYKIKTYAQLLVKNEDQLKLTVFSDVGAKIGIELPLSAQDELDAGKPWSKTTGKNTTPGSWGGHCVFIVGYTTLGPVCVTWGQKQQMTWKWYFKYCSEAYAVINAVNTAKQAKLFDLAAIDAYLKSLKV